MPEGTEEPNKLDIVFCIQDWSGVNQAISLIMISDSMGVKKRMKYLNFDIGHCLCMYYVLKQNNVCIIIVKDNFPTQ